MHGAHDRAAASLRRTLLAFAIVDTEALLEAPLRAIDGGIVGKR